MEFIISDDEENEIEKNKDKEIDIVNISSSSEDENIEQYTEFNKEDVFLNNFNDNVNYINKISDNYKRIIPVLHRLNIKKTTIQKYQKKIEYMNYETIKKVERNLNNNIPDTSCIEIKYRNFILKIKNE